MGNDSQGNYIRPGRGFRRLLREGIPPVLLVLCFAAAIVISWTLVTRAPPARASAPPPAPDEPAFLSVAGAAVDLEVFAPDGRRASTLSTPDSSMTIPGSEGHVECDNYGDPHASEANCTAAVLIRRPAFGDYRVVATSRDARGETLNVGFGGDGFRRSGGFDVRVVLEPAKPEVFTILVSEEGASLRSRPR